MHPAIDARTHNPWSDPMQQQGMNGHPHAMSHEQMATIQAEAAEAAQQQQQQLGPHTNPPAASWSAAAGGGDPAAHVQGGQPPTAWPSVSGDELGAAAAWSAAPGHASMAHDGFLQDLGMHHPHFAPNGQMVADALYVIPPSWSTPLASRTHAHFHTESHLTRLLPPVPLHINSLLTRLPPPLCRLRLRARPPCGDGG